MFHHIPIDKKETMLSEIRRVLIPGGHLHMLDFAGSEAATSGPFTRYFHSSHHVRDNSEECILTLMNRVGLAYCQKVTEGTMLFTALMQRRIQHWHPSADCTCRGLFYQEPWTTRTISHS